MTITKCDVCTKEIEKGNGSVCVGEGTLLPRYIFCKECGAPLVSFLKEKGLV